MKLWPFDILYPETSDQEIEEGVDRARRAGANTLIFYLEEEQMYRTIVDEAGFKGILAKATTLVEEARAAGLKTICYLNGLEVMAHDACDDETTRTLSRTHPEWLQKDISGRPMVWTCIENDWITKDMEDAWASPYSAFRGLMRRRITSLARAGVDALYIDQLSLPGMQNLGERWASSDTRFASAFLKKYGLAVPSRVDWSSIQWRKFVWFRHHAVQSYLGYLTQAARSAGTFLFFEASTNDTSDGTLLGNEPSFSVQTGAGYSPEIEPEGDDLAAFRMAKFARDIRLDQPIIYLGWPANSADALKEFATALCESGNYYPTADSPHPAGAFSFMDAIGDVLDRRVPYAEIALIYSARNKDWTYSDGGAFSRYVTAFTTLSERHLPFRIVPLETLASTPDVDAAVLPGIESIRDDEFRLLKDLPVVLTGDNATRDEWGNDRHPPLHFPNVVSLASLRAHMPFTLTAPARARIEYYTDRDDPGRYFLFMYSGTTTGRVTLSSSSVLTGSVFEMGKSPRELNGKRIDLPLSSPLLVIELRAGS